jgi:hypothetical protein
VRAQAAFPWLAALALAAAAPPAAAADGLGRVLELLAARRHGHVTFTEIQYLGVLERPLESSGELFYDAPDRLEKRTLRPRAEDLLLEHGILTATRGRHSRSLELAAYPQVAPLIESLRATLSGDRAALERAFSVHFDGDAARWTLALVPRDAAAARVVREVRIAGERDVLQSVEILQPDGDRSLLTLGPELPP